VWGGGGVEQRPALTGGDRAGEDVLHAGQPGTGPGVEPGCVAGAGDEVEHAGVVVTVGAGQWQVGKRTEITGGVGSRGGDGEEEPLGRFRCPLAWLFEKELHGDGVDKAYYHGSASADRPGATTSAPNGPGSRSHACTTPRPPASGRCTGATGTSSSTATSPWTPVPASRTSSTTSTNTPTPSSGDRRKKAPPAGTHPHRPRRAGRRRTHPDTALLRKPLPSPNNALTG